MDLPLPSRAPWAMLIVVALGLVAASVPATRAFGPVRGHLFAGAGVTLVGVGWAVLSRRRHAIAIGSSAQGIVVRDDQGGSVVIPGVLVARVVRCDVPGGQVVVVQLANDGWIELAQLADDADAEALARELSRGEHPLGHANTPRNDADPVPAPGREAFVSWHPGRAVGPVSLAVVCFGVGWIARGLALDGASVATVVKAVAFAGASIALVWWCRGLAETRRLGFDADSVIVEQLLLGRVVARRELADIVCIDYADRLHHFGASLLLRREAATSSPRAAVAGGIALPLGSLPLCRRIRVVLAAGARLARRQK